MKVNNKLCKINTQNKIIDKLQKENMLSSNILKYKNDNSSYKMSLSKSRDKYPLLAHDNLIVNNSKSFSYFFSLISPGFIIHSITSINSL